MSEKRFIAKGLVEGVPSIWCDNEVIEQEDVVQLLNEQESTINEQEEHIQLLNNKIKRMIEKFNEIYKLSASERSI